MGVIARTLENKPRTMKTFVFSSISVAAFAIAVWIAGPTASVSAGSDIVNLYSYRQPFLIKPLLDEFTKQTRIRVNTVFAKKGMLEKIRAAGANAVRVQFLDQSGRGQHVNISGAAVTNTAKNRDNAVALIEFLSGETAQRIYASNNHEYPVKNGVPLSDLVASWGTFKADTLSIDEIAKHRRAASMLVDKVGYDDGPSS